ncbi:ATP-binding protein [Candidatus Saccharibacteria bacterium]|nr:ATP-binding protein [Candidatus Saccharibacteria bacterium]
MIKRSAEKTIKGYLKKNKRIIVIFGARQVGKTTLLESVFKKTPDTIWYSGDNVSTQELFSRADLNDLAPLVKGYKTVIIDEAQRIEDIGIKLKILQDNFGDKIQIVATGSSSFDLANKVNEPLTGRKRTITLFPLAVSELLNEYGYAHEKINLANRLVFGSYPAVVTGLEDAKETITELASENLFKDILNLGEIIKTDKLRKILQALAMQVGSQVSMSEIGQLVGLDSKTVDKYIALLEQSFIIFRLPSFARNLRNELKASQKIFFVDCGIRNAISADFRPIDLRPDLGSLFENYVISELKKRFPNDNIYFWRNKNQQEIDYVIEKNGEITAIEVKWNEKKAGKLPSSFVETYHPAHSFTITSENYLDILGGDVLGYLDN